MEGPHGIPPGEGLLGPASRLPGAVGVHGDERTKLAAEALRASEGVVDELQRGNGPGEEALPQRLQVGQPRLRGYRLLWMRICSRASRSAGSGVEPVGKLLSWNM